MSFVYSLIFLYNNNYSKTLKVSKRGNHNIADFWLGLGHSPSRWDAIDYKEYWSKGLITASVHDAFIMEKYQIYFTIEYLERKKSVLLWLLVCSTGNKK